MLNRQEAIAQAGIVAVNKVEEMNCDFTNRLIAGDTGDVEFSASLELENGDVLTAYYYQQDDDIDATDDLGNLDWVIDHYTIN